jgi:DNA-binding NarL/FixJ family response regulator
MSEGHRVRVVMAEDRKTASEAFRSILENAGIEVVAVATTGREAVERTLELRPDVILLDIAMPELDGLAALAIIKYQVPATIAFILTSLTDDIYLARAAELGACGFFAKQADPAQVVDAIRAAVTKASSSTDGRRSTGEPTPLTFSRPRPQENGQERPLDLTDQEAQVLSLLAVGWPNESIMAYLVVSPDTLKAHLRNIYVKIGASNRTGAALWALRHGYGSDDIE